MASDPALAFFLDAPMQSWGASSRFQHRKTESFPTKSGVLGLIAAALGIDKNSSGEADALAPLAELRFSCFAVTGAGKSSPVLRMEDFHTVGGGYDRNDPIERLHISQKASGGPSTTIITHRTFLTGARFIAILEGNRETLNRIADALRNPVWGVWFGRKTCLPASPLLPTVAEIRQAAIEELLEVINKVFPAEIAGGQEQVATDGSWFQADEPISFAKREFRSRPIRRISPNS